MNGFRSFKLNENFHLIKCPEHSSTEKVVRCPRGLSLVVNIEIL